MLIIEKIVFYTNKIYVVSQVDNVYNSITPKLSHKC